MNRVRLEELLWERIDGVISPEDIAELEAHLAEHPQPKELEREIGRLAELLDSPEEVVPPTELRARIDRSLETATAPSPTYRTLPKPITTFGAGHRSFRWLPMAASLVIGVAIGYLLHTGPIAPIDSAQVAGSMVPAAAQPAVLELGQTIGSIEIWRAETVVYLDLHLSGGKNLELILEMPNGERSTLEIDGASARRLVFESAEALRLEVRENGTVVAQHLIEAFDPEAQP